MASNSKEKAGERPRILLVTTVGETVATILKGQPRFLRQHFEVHVAFTDDGFAEHVAASEGVEIHRITLHRRISPIADIRAMLAMIILLRRMKPMLIHSYTPKAGLVAMVASMLARVPVRIHTFTGLIFPTSHGFRKKLLLWADRLIAACATKVVPEGSGVAAELRRGHVTRKPLQVIGHGNIAGVDTAHYHRNQFDLQVEARELRAKLQISPQDFIFAFVGRLNKDKGIEELVEAFQALPSGHLLLVGKNDDSAPIDRETAERIRNHPRIYPIGFMTDVRPALLAADILVLPSYREGFPNVVLQAGAMELPVIATNINGCNEIIEPGNTGWLVPARNSTALATAMADAMLKSTESRIEMGKKARLDIQQRFEQKTHWERMRTFYTMALQNKC